MLIRGIIEKKYCEPIEAMTIINPRFCKAHTLQVEVKQGGEGSIPHVHVYHDKTRNPKKCSCIRLDKAEYSPHHKIVKLPKNIKREFIELMQTPWVFPHASADSDYLSTGYEAAVDVWVDTYEDGSYEKFDVDDLGNLIMPDYTKL